MLLKTVADGVSDEEEGGAVAVEDDEAEDEEVEGDKILKEVLDEIGVDLSQKVGYLFLYDFQY